MRKVKIISAIILIAAFLIGVLIYFGCFEDDFNVYVEVDTDADFMLVINRDELNSQKCFIIEDKKEMKNYLKSYKWHIDHLMCCGNALNAEYIIKVIKDEKVSTTIYHHDYDWADLYNAELVTKTKDYINEFKNREIFYYKYIVSVPAFVDYEKLKIELNQEEGFHVYSEYPEESSPKYSYFEFRYKNLNEKTCDLGEIESDNIFIPIIDELKKDRLFVTASKVRSRMNSSYGNYFIREIKIYIKNPVDEIIIKKYRRMWKDEFGYKETKEYSFAIISDHELSKEENEKLLKKYNISIEENEERGY